MSNIDLVIKKMRQAKVETDLASPNFVNDFAHNRGIELYSFEVVEISDSYTLEKPKRYKKSFSSNSQVCHAFASQNQAEGHSANVFFEGNKIYSYGLHFLMGQIVTVKGQKICFITSRGYSSSTSSHLSDLRSAVSHYKTYYVDDPSNPMTDINERAAKIGENLLDILSQTRPYFSEKSFLDDVNEFNELCDLFDKPKDKIVIEDSLIETVLEHCKKRQIRNAELDKPKLEARKIQQAEYKEIKRLKEIEDARILESWVLGADVNLGYSVAMKLRIKGEVVQTSHGATVPLKHAIKLWSKIKAREASKGDRVGLFELNEYSKKMIVIGCHEIPVSEVERVIEPLIMKGA